jgi:hypothetical protein
VGGRAGRPFPQLWTSSHNRRIRAYEDRQQWIVGIYFDREEAERIAGKGRPGLADKAAYNAWSDKRLPLYWAEVSRGNCRLGVLTDEAEFRQQHRSCPNDGWEADKFDVVAVPIGIAGCY